MDYESKLIQCEKQAMQDIIKNLRTDKKLMSEIVMNIQGELTDDIGSPLVLAFLNGDREGLFNKFSTLFYSAVKLQAEYQAKQEAIDWEEQEMREEEERRSNVHPVFASLIAGFVRV